MHRISSGLALTLAIITALHARGAHAAPPTNDLKLSGFIQSQLVLHESDKQGVDKQGRPENKDRFEVRRARLKLSYARGSAEAVLHVDAVPAGVRVLDAEASWKLKWHGDATTKFTAGLFRVPFGYELQESMSSHPFTERSIWANRFFPGVRDIGVRVWGSAWNEALVYQLAVQNGSPSGDALFPGVDPNSGKDVTARVGTHLGPLRAGVSGLLGRGYTPPDATTRQVNYGRSAVGADVVVTLTLPSLGDLGLYAEAVYGENMDRSRAEDLPQRTAGGVRDRRAFGAYAGVLQHLGPLVAVGARYDYFDRDVTGPGDEQTALDLVAHLYPMEPVRLTVAYQLHFETPSVEDNQFWLRAQVRY